MEFQGFDLDKARKYLECVVPFAEAKKPFEEEMEQFLEVTRERLQQNLGQDCWSQLTVKGEYFEVGLTYWGGAWQAFTDVRVNRLPADSHCIWWGFYAAPGSGKLLAYWGIEPRSEKILTHCGPAFEHVAKKLGLEVRRVRPDLAIYWGSVGGVSLERWKDSQSLLLDRAGQLIVELTSVALPGVEAFKAGSASPVTARFGAHRAAASHGKHRRRGDALGTSPGGHGTRRT